MEFEPLRRAYVRAMGPITGPEFLRLVDFLTRQPEAPPLPTGKPDIRRHVIRIPGTDEPVQVLRLDGKDGSVPDLRIPDSDAEADIRRLCVTMQKAATKRGKQKSRAAARAGKSASAAKTKAAPRPPHDRVWRRHNHELRKLHAEYLERAPDKSSGPNFIRLLQQCAKEPGAARPTQEPGIDRCVVTLPGLGRDIVILLHHDTGGELTDLRLLPSAAEEGHVMDEMIALQVNRNRMSTRVARPTQRPLDRDNMDQLWRTHLQRPLEAQFQGYIERPEARHQSRPSGREFVQHLNDLCNKVSEGVVHKDYGITRHVITPEGSNEPITLLRRMGDSGVVKLRFVGRGLMDEALAIKSIIDYIEPRTSAQLVATSATVDTAALPISAAPDIPARPSAARARTQAMKSADHFRQVLEAMVENKEGGKLDYLDGVAQKTGVPGPALRSWLTHDGKLRRSFNVLALLGGFFEQRQEIHRLFSELGHPDVAERLPQPFSAELVATVLKARLDNPSATSGAGLARMTQCNRRVIERLIYPRTGKLRISNARLQHLPGYDVHWKAIRAALDALGHVTSGIPKPATPGELFLRAIREDLYPMAAAVDAMRRDPGLSLRQAAGLMSDSEEMADLLDVLVGPGGKVRQRADIEARLPDLALHQLPNLDALLAQLQPPPLSGMRRVVVPGFASFGAKLFIVKAPADAAGIVGRQKTDLASIYADSPELVMPPRSFKHERGKQALRWLSTVLKSEFKTIEVQCYYDAKRRNIWVSSNNEGVNRKIKSYLSGGKLMSQLAGMDGHDHANREGRHRWKLARKLANPESGLSMMPVLQAMSEARFRVPTDTVYQHSKPIDLHAERRIKEAFQEATNESLDLQSLAGTMRPCTVCANDLGLPKSARRGPAWLSRAAQAFYDANVIVEKNIVDSIGTYASRTRDGTLSVNYNTDSESDRDVSTAKPGSSAQLKLVQDVHEVPIDGQASQPRGGSGRNLPPANINLVGVLGKRKASSNPSSSITTTTAGTSKHPRHALPPDSDALAELTQHLDALNWPTSTHVPTWRPASPLPPDSPEPDPAAEE